MTNKVDLANGTPEDIRQFVVAVTGLAVTHEQNNTPAKGWTGAVIVGMFAHSWRGFHKSMASHLYNKTRDTVRCFTKDD